VRPESELTGGVQVNLRLRLSPGCELGVLREAGDGHARMQGMEVRHEIINVREVIDGWRLPKAKSALKIELVSPDLASNPAAFHTAEIVAGDWNAIGLSVTHVPLPPGEFVSGRLATGKFSAAVGDVTIGLDPDLYPLLASSQTVTGGSNVIGLQDPALDKLLRAARGPGTQPERMAAYAALQMQLAKGRFVLPLAFADESIVVRDTLQGAAINQVADAADRFWDVLTWRLAAGR
jgi:ABC-type transport system substrate-binding protein